MNNVITGLELDQYEMDIISYLAEFRLSHGQARFKDVALPAMLKDIPGELISPDLNIAINRLRDLDDEALND